jgi:hypothetical protein
MKEGESMDCLHANKVMSFIPNKANDSYTKIYKCKNCKADLPIDTDEFSIDKVRSIGFGSGTLPTRHAASNAVEEREKRWAKDMPAYKALRAQGLQPPRIDGSAKLMAHAETRFEVESGQILPGQSKKIEAAVTAVESITGKSLYEPNTTPVNL